MAPFFRSISCSASAAATRIHTNIARTHAPTSALNATVPCRSIHFDTLNHGQAGQGPSYRLPCTTSCAISPIEHPWRAGCRRPFSQKSRSTSRSHQVSTQRSFHTYFVSHLPRSSLHPDSRNTAGPGHKLPRDASTPHTPAPGSAPAVAPPYIPPTRDLTVVRIPLRRAKHHLGVATARGSRPYNEDRDQAGTISIPAFAKRAPRSVRQKPGEATPADSAWGDPQVFYFGVFDGHGGTQCAEFLQEELHGYIENASAEFGLQSSLRKTRPGTGHHHHLHHHHRHGSPNDAPSSRMAALQALDMKGPEEVKDKMVVPEDSETGFNDKPEHAEPMKSVESPPAKISDHAKAIRLETELVDEYKQIVGGYFRRFTPEHFVTANEKPEEATITVESVLEYAFLRADLDFVSAQAKKLDPDDSRISEAPLNKDEVFGSPSQAPSGHNIGGPTRFKGGSTASIALISTPTPAPFWHPAAHSTLLVAHVGDSRILLCDTTTGLAHPLTSDHHPTTPTESRRLRRYAPAGSMVSGDSFGEERIAGLANSRAFGDMKSKRIGVSAEPEITRVEMGPAQYSFVVLMSDGISGTLSDQEIVDVIKEARTPEEGARNVVDYATEVSRDGDNATCQVVRLGGWERRSEGGVGSLGTKEIRDARRAEALDPRGRKR